MAKSKLKNPLNMYYNGTFKKQKQSYPGIQAEMDPVPDCGEESYVGHGLLEGRKALITGGDSGIGRAAAIAYAREGADVAINFLQSEKKDAEEVKQLIEAEGRKAVLIPGDISDEKTCVNMIQRANSELGGLDILTMVAGVQRFEEKIEDIETKNLIKTYETNVFSLFWLCKEAIKHMPKGSSIITTSSIEGYVPGKILLDYASSKSAIISFTKAFAKQIAPRGIRVNCVAPGPYWTALQICGGQPQKKIPEFGKETAFERAGQPVELSPIYVFLASEQASYVTGEVYAASGGQTPY